MIRAQRTHWSAGIVLAAAFLTMGQTHAQGGIRVHMHGSDGYAADGLLYVPSGQGPFSAIVLIPDSKGLTQRITDAAMRFCDAGFLTIAVDLNRGLAAQPGPIDEHQAESDLNATFAFLGAQTNVRQSFVGAMGWGTGGLIALKLAADGKVIALVVDGLPLSPKPLHAIAPSIPVLAIFAGRDVGAPVAARRSFEVALNNLNPRSQVKIYPDAEPGFDDPEDGPHFRSTDAADVTRLAGLFLTNQLHGD